jgi:hypothetical protein
MTSLTWSPEFATPVAPPTPAPVDASPQEAAAVPAPPQPLARREPIKVVRLPAMTYRGFRTTPEGREYSISVGVEGAAPRLFVLFIAHTTFASGEARFQDAPDLCCGRLRRELLANADLLPGPRLVITGQELLQYREHHAPPNRRRGAA